ncbi:MAG: hypothetical protein HC836_45030 [Richelia sp. RM2_1_2]|nr:hypothetical protein [Richelia sp. RM2_1_2]
MVDSEQKELINKFKYLVQGEVTEVTVILDNNLLLFSFLYDRKTPKVLASSFITFSEDGQKELFTSLLKAYTQGTLTQIK